MSADIGPLELLPLLFFTAMTVYVLAMGSADLARSLIRLAALAASAACLGVWGVAALSYESWGRPVIDEFYATSIIERHLGALRSGWLLMTLAVVPAAFALREAWLLKTTR
ncbi:hypothetical protein [Pelagibius marinus]|uniref:hypothetical protein n=1 Tax=Pelagibius marinus TaxID=2762760 RepID=UPI001873240B|nr:hypothetical protein [Pelagibius marinus]